MTALKENQFTQSRKDANDNLILVVLVPISVPFKVRNLQNLVGQIRSHFFSDCERQILVSF